jgi:hypothetical protein
LDFDELYFDNAKEFYKLNEIHRLHTFLSNFFYGYDTNDRGGQKYPNENDLKITEAIFNSITEYNSITKYNFVEKQNRKKFYEYLRKFIVFLFNFDENHNKIIHSLKMLSTGESVRATGKISLPSSDYFDVRFINSLIPHDPRARDPIFSVAMYSGGNLRGFLQKIAEQWDHIKKNPIKKQNAYEELFQNYGHFDEKLKNLCQFKITDEDTLISPSPENFVTAVSEYPDGGVCKYALELYMSKFPGENIEKYKEIHNRIINELKEKQQDDKTKIVLPLVIPRQNKEKKVFPDDKYEEYMEKLCVNIMKSGGLERNPFSGSAEDFKPTLEQFKEILCDKNLWIDKGPDPDPGPDPGPGPRPVENNWMGPELEPEPESESELELEPESESPLTAELGPAINWVEDEEDERRLKLELGGGAESSDDQSQRPGDQSLRPGYHSPRPGEDDSIPSIVDSILTCYGMDVDVKTAINEAKEAKEAADVQVTTAKAQVAAANRDKIKAEKAEAEAREAKTVAEKAKTEAEAQAEKAKKEKEQVETQFLNATSEAETKIANANSEAEKRIANANSEAEKRIANAAEAAENKRLDAEAQIKKLQEEIKIKEVEQKQNKAEINKKIEGIARTLEISERNRELDETLIELEQNINILDKTLKYVMVETDKGRLQSLVNKYKTEINDSFEKINLQNTSKGEKMDNILEALIMFPKQIITQLKQPHYGNNPAINTYLENLENVFVNVRLFQKELYLKNNADFEGVVEENHNKILDLSNIFNNLLENINEKMNPTSSTAPLPGGGLKLDINYNHGGGQGQEATEDESDVPTVFNIIKSNIDELRNNTNVDHKKIKGEIENIVCETRNSFNEKNPSSEKTAQDVSAEAYNEDKAIQKQLQEEKELRKGLLMARLEKRGKMSQGPTNRGGSLSLDY